ncbi:MAG: fluoride efflux transporter FluC [Acidimicrobiales bacterium]
MTRTGHIQTALVVGAGGAVGAAGRWLVGEAISTDFPWATIVVNVLGCALLAAVLRPGATDRAIALLGTGFCGGLTTFSTLAVDVVTLSDDSRGLDAGWYLVLSMTLGLGAYVLVRGLAIQRVGEAA